MASVIDRSLAAVVAAAKWLVFPLVLLLFAQWPLREVVRGGSREANDLGQVLFAVLVAVSVTAATRAGTHLTPGTRSGRYPPRVRRGLRLGLSCLVLAPWSVLVLVSGWPQVVASVRLLEHFSETGNPGYFVVKVAGIGLAALVLAQALLDAARALRDPP